MPMERWINNIQEDKVFYIHVEICNEKTDEFILHFPNLPAWKTSNSEKVTKLWQIDTCCNNLEAVIEFLCYSW